MHIDVRRIEAWHQYLLRAASRGRPFWASRRPNSVVSSGGADGARVLGWYLRAWWLRARRHWVSGLPAGAPPKGAGFPLASQRQAAGWPSASGQSGPGDGRLLTGLTREAGRDAQVVTVRPVPGDSRAGPLILRDQDRRWLCRELHDGLGPALAGLTLGLGTAQALSAGQPDLQHLLGRLAAETQRAVTDLRRIVYGLRPSVLDELGLAGSLREEAGRLQCAAPALAVSLEVPGDGLAGLPVAAEVACYRIVTEALTNVARHARATRCTVRLRLDHGLRIDVRDNGVGLPAGWRAGAGIASMRERACELGGELTIGPCRPHGTRITALLPGLEPP